jgi:methanogenic corrinoid protein MtbC1
MPARDKEPVVFGHNEETFEFFTKLAKEHKAKVLRQSELMKDVDMNKIDITELHKIINQTNN